MSAEIFVREKLRRYAQLRERMDIASADDSSISLEAQQKKLIDLTKYYEETTMMMNNLQSPKNTGDTSGNSAQAQKHNASDEEDQRDDSVLVWGKKVPVVNEEQRYVGLRRDNKTFDSEFREVTCEQVPSSASLGGTSESGKSKYEQALDRLAQIRHRSTAIKTPGTTVTAMKTVMDASDTSAPVTSLSRKAREPKGFLLGEHTVSKHERLVQKSIVSRKTAFSPSGDSFSLPPTASTKSSIGSGKSACSDVIPIDDKVVDVLPSRPVNPARLFIDTSIVSKDLEKGNADSRKVSKDFMSAFSYEFKKKPDPEEQSDIIHLDDILDDKPHSRERLLMRTSSSDENTHTKTALFEDAMPISIKLRRKTSPRESVEQSKDRQRNHATAPIVVEEECDDDGDLLSQASIRLSRINTPRSSKSSVEVKETWQTPETVDAEADYLAIQRNRQTIQERETQEHSEYLTFKKNEGAKHGEFFGNSLEGTIVDAEDDYRKIQERSPKAKKGPPLIGRLKTCDTMPRTVHFHEINDDEQAISHVKPIPSVTQGKNHVFHSVHYADGLDSNHASSKNRMIVVEEEITMDQQALSPMSQLQQRLATKHLLAIRKGKSDVSKNNPEKTMLDSTSPSTNEQKKVDACLLSSISTHLDGGTTKYFSSNTKKVNSSSSLLSKATSLNTAKKTDRGFSHVTRHPMNGDKGSDDLTNELNLNNNRANSSSFHENSSPNKQTTTKYESATVQQESESLQVVVSSDTKMPDKYIQSAEQKDKNRNDTETVDDHAPYIEDSQSDSLLASAMSPPSYVHGGTQLLHDVAMKNLLSPRRHLLTPEGSPMCASESSVPERVQELQEKDATCTLEHAADNDEQSSKTTSFSASQMGNATLLTQENSFVEERESQHNGNLLEDFDQTVAVSPNGMVKSFSPHDWNEVDEHANSMCQNRAADTEQHNELADCNEKSTSAGNGSEMADEQGEGKTGESGSRTSHQLVEANSSEKLEKKIKNDIEITTSEDNSTDTEQTEDKMFVVYSESLGSDMDTAETDKYDACAFPFALRILDTTCAWLESDELCKSKSSLLRKVKKRTRRQLGLRNSVKSTNAITPKSVYVTQRLRSVENAPKKTNNFRRNFATETNLSPGSQSSKTPTMSNISKRSFTNNLLRCGRNASIDESKTKDPEIRSSFLSPEKPDIQSLTSTSIELHIATTGRAGMKALEGLPKASTDSSEENLKLDGSMELQIKEDPPSPPEKDSIVEVPGRTHEENVSSSRHENNHQKRSASTTLNFTRELAGGPEMIQTSEKLKRNVSDTNVENVQDIPNRDLFDSDSTALPSSSSDSSGLSSLEVEQRIAAVDLADKLRRRAATLKRRRKIREKQRLFRANQSHATSATL